MNSEMGEVPWLSIIVVVYEMQRQAENTLFSLSASYQRDVDAKEYEVIVVENRSARMLDEHVVSSLGEGFRYYRRSEPGRSPVPAINFAFGKCRSDFVGLIIDGARLVTPRVISYARMARKISADSLVLTPSYHVGSSDLAASEEYDEAVERVLLSDLRWREDGYRLFRSCRFSEGNKSGYLHPFMESGCIFASMRQFEQIGFADERYSLPGGGAINLHILRSLGLLPSTRLFVLPGEGSFHQLHGGVTTSDYEGRNNQIVSFRDQLQGIWNGQFRGLRREPMLLGVVTPPAMNWLEKCAGLARQRFEELHQKGRAPWEDDVGLGQIAPENRRSTKPSGT